ncbi:hypothetical protein TcYC6_0001720 [Trypanosoma cruzi]|nr:hypothetical protein TcYC6_0001720 [Trypanosoma cruzi]
MTPRHTNFTSCVFFKPQPRGAARRYDCVRDPTDGRLVAKTIVYPCLTELFVQGDIDGFDAEYQAVVLTEEYKRKKAEMKSKKHAAQANDDLE